VDELVTECFTRRLCEETGTTNPKQAAAAFKLIDATSWELVAAAYFDGK
jgi:hypothetical protein